MRMRGRGVVALLAVLAAGMALAAWARPVALKPACDGLLGLPCPMPRCDPAAVPAIPAAVSASAAGGASEPVRRDRPALLGLAANTASDGRIAPDVQARWAARAGARVIRFAVDWRAVEPRRDVWDEAAWRRLRATAGALADRGIAPLAVLTNAPRWISEDRLRPWVHRSGYVPVANHDGDRRWRRFVAEAVRRLPQVRRFELWNEPNLPGSWGGRTPDPVHYARLVREAEPVIHAQRPGALVLAGAIAGVDPAPYVRCLFDPGGIAGHYDAFSLHAYPTARDGRVEDPVAGSDVEAQVRATADAVHAFDPGARLWITETGVTTSGPRAVSPAEQARAVIALRDALAARPGVDAVLFHTLFDVAALPVTDPEHGFGWVALDARGRPHAKPALRALGAP